MAPDDPRTPPNPVEVPPTTPVEAPRPGPDVTDPGIGIQTGL